MTVFKGEIFVYYFQFYLWSKNGDNSELTHDPFAQFAKEVLKVSVSTDINYVNLAIHIDEPPAPDDTVVWDEIVELAVAYTADATLGCPNGGVAEVIGGLENAVVPPGSYDLTARIRGRADVRVGGEVSVPSPRGAEHVELIFTSVRPG
ncbi:hypothetical protein [Williamsia sp. CHRR-6]|uniref:hypothetical protein n=1 Tax=Williamsia sp. CHRR-6 TaxID=2835871 RepID=UPI001BDA60B9|nr:hypothetical protein [Williamsia sp. CHRR-6]MBT0567138.1 hypothetical protein [Williamsia sp. CHRR-6]